jgi:ornithine carbamoyltransferase
MLKLKTKHVLTGEELSADELSGLLDAAQALADERRQGRTRTDLAGKCLTLLFDKPSLRTRVSFTAAMQEAGGNVIECLSSTRKSEEPEDVAKVLGGYCHAVMIRTHEHKIVERMAAASPIPIINGLSDSHHPCQVMADLLTLRQSFGSLQGLEFAYVGDGNNMLHSLLLLLPFMGVKVRYACPPGYEPSAFIVKQARKRAKEGGGSIEACADPVQAVKGTSAVYTDVWTSMGFEKEEKDRERAFADFQLNEALFAHAASNAIIMHCMPMERGKEISETLANHPSTVFYRQSENRLHAQKALLLGLLGK